MNFVSLYAQNFYIHTGYKKTPPPEDYKMLPGDGRWAMGDGRAMKFLGDERAGDGWAMSGGQAMGDGW